VYELLIKEPKSGYMSSTLYDTQTAVDIATESHLKHLKNIGYVIQEEGINKYYLQSVGGVVKIVQQTKLPVFTRY
jgi:ABC-type Mn2+/Zn2+ transport system ATPase subunit